MNLDRPAPVPQRFSIIDLIAYTGGIWYFLTNILLGPFVRNFISKRFFVAEIGKQLYYKISQEENNHGKSGRAKIDVGQKEVVGYEELHNESGRSEAGFKIANKKKKSRFAEADADETGRDLEMEGGQPQPMENKNFFKNTIKDPFNNSSRQFQITERRIDQAFDIIQLLRVSQDSRNFLSEFLTDEQSSMLAKNKRNYINYFEQNQQDIIAYIQSLEQ